ncbi:PepSY1/2 domain-containing protein [Sulfoacidibacillus thermotolerans]|uniref:Uncharacterized protein n=1 Tax=Sulfoacidibacillus thermotolerans TaxID=1765684 RepID=A0A2U3DCP7_SULT2|nr:PepSY1/2 domain-containing protein [Sulfoacidibacillus thermotolerans]PWI59060.1 hypothetical protein BM613_00140 [Sulfoacidibacillus thermotolerans]
MKKKRVKRTSAGWVIPALALGFIGMSLYGYQEHRLQAASLAELESGYQSAFHSMIYNLDELQDALANALVPKSGGEIVRQLHLAASEAARAESYASHLPETLTQQSGLQRFLGTMIQKTEALSDQHANGTPFSTNERKQIQFLYREATDVERAARSVQTQMMQHKNTIIHMTSTFAAPTFTVTQQAKQYFSEIGKHVPKLNIQDAMTKPHEESNSHFHSVQTNTSTGPWIDSATAIARARSVLGVSSRAHATAESLGLGYGVPGYLITVSPTPKAAPSYVAITKHGGAILWMARDGLVVAGRPRLSVEQGARDAERFLQQQRLTGFIEEKAVAYDGMANYTFVPLHSGVRLLTEPVLMKIDLTTGDVTHYDATKFLTAQPVNISLQHRLTPEQAKEALHPDFHITSIHLALIENSSHQPVLAYDIAGQSVYNVFHVDVDANTGQVLKIDKLTKAETRNI